MSSEQRRDDHECIDYIEQIVYLIDNELDEPDVVTVEHHIRECGPCHERYEVQRTVKAIVARSCSEQAPSGLRERIRLAITEVRPAE